MLPISMIICSCMCMFDNPENRSKMEWGRYIPCESSAKCFLFSAQRACALWIWIQITYIIYIFFISNDTFLPFYSKTIYWEHGNEWKCKIIHKMIWFLCGERERARAHPCTYAAATAQLRIDLYLYVFKCYTVYRTALRVQLVKILVKTSAKHFDEIFFFSCWNCTWSTQMEYALN